MNKNEYFLYNSGIPSLNNTSQVHSSGADSPLIMFKMLNAALKQSKHHTSKQPPTSGINPHRPISMCNPQQPPPPPPPPTSMQITRPMQHVNLFSSASTNNNSRKSSTTSTITKPMHHHQNQHQHQHAPPVLKSAVHTSIQKLIKLEDLYPSPSFTSSNVTGTSGTGNYLIKYPVQHHHNHQYHNNNNNNNTHQETNIYDEIDYGHAPIMVHQMNTTKSTKLRQLSSKINCCFKSAQSRRRQSDELRSISSSRQLNSSGSSSSSGISVASSSLAADETANKGILRLAKSPVISSGYNSSQELSNSFQIVANMNESNTNRNNHHHNNTSITSGSSCSSRSTTTNAYNNNNNNKNITGLMNFKPSTSASTTTPAMANKTHHPSRQQIESLKRLQELELIKFNQKQALLDQNQLSESCSSSSEYEYNSSNLSSTNNNNYESLLARKLEKSSLATNVDSGISTLGGGGGGGGSVARTRATLDTESNASDATSNLSAYLSSSPIFSSSNSTSSSLAEWSPFPKVKTCMIAHVKPLRTAAKTSNASVSTTEDDEDDDPIYENLGKFETRSANKSKQYSVKDVFCSLKSLENEWENEDDLLCDKEVDFYLNGQGNSNNMTTTSNNFAQYFNFNSYLSSQSQQQFLQNHNYQHHNQQHHQTKSNQHQQKPKQLNKASTKMIKQPVALWEQLV